MAQNARTEEAAAAGAAVEISPYEVIGAALGRLTPAERRALENPYWDDVVHLAHRLRAEIAAECVDRFDEIVAPRAAACLYDGLLVWAASDRLTYSEDWSLFGGAA